MQLLPLDPVALVIATVIADLIVAGGWVVMLVAAVVWLRKRQATLLAQLPPDAVEEPEGLIRWALYVVSFIFWPAALAIGAYFLGRPQTVRAGVVCSYLFLAYVSVSVVVAIAIVTVGAALAPRWLG